MYFCFSYGDVYASTDLGRMLVSAIIVIAVIQVPQELQNLSELNQLEKDKKQQEKQQQGRRHMRNSWSETMWNRTSKLFVIVLFSDSPDASPSPVSILPISVSSSNNNNNNDSTNNINNYSSSDFLTFHHLDWSELQLMKNVDLEKIIQMCQTMEIKQQITPKNVNKTNKTNLITENICRECQWVETCMLR